MLTLSPLGMRVLWIWALLSLPAAVLPSCGFIWCILGMLLFVVYALEALLLRLDPLVNVERILPDRFAVGEKGEIQLGLHHTSPRSLIVEVYDGIPADARADAMPWMGLIPSASLVQVRYDVILPRRGECCFGSIHLRVLGRMRLLKRAFILPRSHSVKVYPNYAPALRLALLATQHRQEQMGIVRRSRAGSSRDFHQLRDYRQGDGLSQIDWKSTSRRLQLISRDYQEQRNQQVVFLLDCGCRMRSLDGDLPQFDHCLNALLMVSYLALRQGDHVAIQSFGGTDRWLPPVKGLHSMATILDHLYDAETTPSPSDFAQAAESLMMRFRRRALVVVMTNLRGEDSEEMVPALRSLQTKHLVLLASLCEGSVRDAVNEPVADFTSALRHVAARQYMTERAHVLKQLQSQGVSTLDCIPSELAIALANRYLDVKTAGTL